MTLRGYINTRLKPGTVVVLENGTKLLVGDINPLGGVCDDCPHDDLDVEVSHLIVPADPKEQVKQ